MKNKLTAFLGLFIVSLTTVLNADTIDSDTASKLNTQSSTTIGEIFGNGGLTMWVLVLISIFTLATVIYLAIAHRPEAIVPNALRRDVIEKIRVGQLVEARNLCDDKPCAFSYVAEVAISKALFDSERNQQAIETVVVGEGERQASKINSAAQWLLDISTVAPMIGLFGTVVGMLIAFGALGSEGVAAAKPVALAQGVSKALVTTIAGLCVAIPALICYAFFRRRAARRILELERAANEVVSTVIQG